MIHRSLLTLLLLVVTATAPASIRGQAQSTERHDAWVWNVLNRMQSIKPGMTRDDLLKVFQKEGGAVLPTRRTFVSQDCLYFKVDVEFDTGGRPTGRMVEDGRDIIVKISKPYLAPYNLD